MSAFRIIILSIIITTLTIVGIIVCKSRSAGVLDERVNLRAGEDFNKWLKRKEPEFDRTDFERLKFAYSQIYVSIHFPDRKVMLTEAVVRQLVSRQTPRTLIIEGYLLFGEQERLLERASNVMPTKNDNLTQARIGILKEYLNEEGGGP